jgi:hypothetical protein
MLVGFGFVLAAACAASTLGTWHADAHAPGPGAHVAGVLLAAIAGGGLAALYVGAGAGWGRVLLRACRVPVDAAGPLAPLTGLAFLLVLSHALGWLGVLNGVTAWLTVGVGVCVWAASKVGRAQAADAPDRAGLVWWLAAVPAVGVMLAAASSPPGWLWRSEAGGYDTLSYHLQLVREWLDLGRLAPLEHNVYSYLPSYAEAAYLHLAHMARPLGPVLGPGLGGSVGSLPEAAILGAAWLHALVALLSARAVVRTARVWLGDAGAPAAVLAGAAVLATPWVVVAGSLAYNDLFVVALGAGCVLAAVVPGVSPLARGAVIGLLGSAAVGAKPTSVFMLAPLTLAALAVATPALKRAEWMRLVVAAVVVGSLAGAPWLVRNAAASGNPVFPFGRAVFGDGPWTPEQHARYSAAHRFDGSLGERLGVALGNSGGLGGAAAGGKVGLGGQPRGPLHEQWSILFPVGVTGLGLGLLSRRTHRASAAMLAALIAQIVAWLTFTHIQSRFLLPCVVPLGLGVGLGAASATERLGGHARARLAVAAVASACVAWLSVRTVLVFSAERSGRPNAMLAYGVSGLTGALEPGQPPPPPDALRELPGPETFVNMGGLAVMDAPGPGPEAGLYLFGDATPLYFEPPGGVRLVYHTTYDRGPWPVGTTDPAAWAAALRERGVRYVVVNTMELDRLGRSGWYDPAVTPERVEQFVSEYTRVIASWPRRGQRLCVLNGAGPGSPSK